MINIDQGYEKVAERWREFWNMANDERPLICLTAPKKDAVLPPAPTAPDTIKERWLDTEFHIKSVRRGVEGTIYLGESFPSYSPNLGPDFVGAVCGCDLEFSPSTSWAEPCINDYEDFPTIKFDENNKWWKKMVEFTNAALDEANGDFLVGITDLHPAADAIVSLRGAEVAAMDLYDEPEQFKKRVWEVFDVFKEIAKRSYELTSTKQKGTTNWMGLLHPDDLWYVTSCDFSYMISSEHFHEFVLPELKAELDWLPHSVYHLDGVGSLTHLDTLLSLEKLHGIQWVPGHGKPSPLQWIELYQKIQKAGKGLQIGCSANEVIPLCEALDPQGVQLSTGGLDEDSSRALIKEVERIYKQKRGVFTFK
jgi:hypothetical protein